ncbi:tafazzin isoform X1 [Atheta coriaria]|uniref:tafazzin isoform X1 n=1 Tax=Dalotia coriaria TaxID=877792 RepID=UPI0031F3DAD9
MVDTTQSSQASTNNIKIPYDIKWVVPAMRHPTRLWHFASAITLSLVGIFSKIVIKYFSSAKVYNRKNILKAIDERPVDVPLITVSNHHSCFDDPGIWGTLNWRNVLRPHKMRWSLAAHDICFTNSTHSQFFMWGQCIPVVRGAGVFQPAVDLCVDLLRRGHWVHVFPEGKVNMTKENLRLKWGVGRMIYESPVTPIIVPIWHIGMDDLLPNEPPYYFRLGKQITFNYGKPLDLGDVVKRLRARNASDEEARKEITDIIQHELMKLKAETEGLHNEYFKIKSL